MRRSTLTFVLPLLFLLLPKLLLGQGATPAADAAPESLTASFAARLTEQTVTVTQSLDKALASMQKQLSSDMESWPKKADKAMASEALKTLISDWDKQVASINKGLGALLLAGDDAILKDTGASVDLEGILGPKLRESRKDLSASIKAALQDGASALLSLKTDQVQMDASTGLDDAFAAARDAAMTKLIESLKARSQSLLPLFADSSAAETQQAQIEEVKFKAADDQTFLQQFSTETGLSKVIRCSWSAQKRRLACLPKALLVSGSEVSEIRIEDLPPGKKVRVRAFVGAEARTIEAGCGRLDGSLMCDKAIFSTSSRRTVIIAIHIDRFFLPSYGKLFGTEGYALEALRGGEKSYKNTAKGQPEVACQPCLGEDERTSLSLLVKGRSAEVQVDVQVEGRGNESTVRSVTIPLAYQRWDFETGAFFAFTNLNDQELVTEPATGSDSMGKVKVVKRVASDTYTQETGVFLSVFHRSYPKLGFGVGFHTSSGRAPSFYFGPTIRLLRLGQHALLTASAGVAVLPVKRFPSVNVGDTYDSNDAVLQGKIGFRNGLGFSFGPLDNGDAKGK
jgi:hypothetical protein